MPRNEEQRGGPSADEATRGSAAHVQRIANLLGLLLVRDKNQNEQIVTLGAAGFTPAEIATLLGTTRNTVSVTLSQYKSKRVPPSKRKATKSKRNTRKK